MFAAIQFRLCLSLIPVMLSIPLAWKVHETKILNTIHDQEINAKTCEYILLNSFQLKVDAASLLRGKQILALLRDKATWFSVGGVRHFQGSQIVQLLDRSEISADCLADSA